MRSDVLIVGAGPTGLVLALWLAKFGVKVRLIDKTAQPGTTSRALAVQARTLELYRQLDLAETRGRAGAQGRPRSICGCKGERAARLPFETVGADLTPYAFLQIFPQDQHERLLIERLGASASRSSANTELIGFTDEGDHVVARLRGPDGTKRPCEASYIAGCDGARSLVRETIGHRLSRRHLSAGFLRRRYRWPRGPPLDGELHIDLDEADFLAVFPLAGEGRARLIGTGARRAGRSAPTSSEFEDVGEPGHRSPQGRISKRSIGSRPIACTIA